MVNKIIITEDPDCEMLDITIADGQELFHGNAWDFNRDGETFKQLFENLGISVVLKKKDMSDGN